MDDDAHDLDEPVTEPLHPPPPARKVAPAVAGLAAFGFSLPLVRVLAGAPEFFVAHDVGRGVTLAFWAVVVLGVPLALAALALLPGERGDTLRTALLAGLGGLGAASVLQPVAARPVLFLVGVVAAMVAVPYYARRSPPFLATLGLASVGCLVLAAVVVGPSRTGDYLRSGEAEVVATRAEGDLAPVVVIVLDEMPLAPLLDSGLHVDADRFPAFAALAATSDWYRLAASVSPNTTFSVPALLSGQRPAPGAVPVASAYPTNLFLQLASRYEVRAFESTTALCPRSICDEGGAGAAGEASSTPAAPPGPIEALVSDAWVVFRHAIGTDNMRASLPSVSGSWEGFTTAVDVAEAEEGDDGAATDPVFDHTTFARESAALEQVMATPATTDRPQLRVAHITAPHAPWVATPDGTLYGDREISGTEVVDGVLHWTGSEADRRVGYQRMVLQIGAVDAVLGRVRAQLEADGLWDEAAVVVTADHGTQFEEGYFRDPEAGGVEVTGVPLFVKAPGQTEGSVDDRAVLTEDVVPTILGAIGVRSPSRFGGLDVGRDEVPAVRDDAFVLADGTAVTPDQSLDALRALVARRARWIDPEGGWDAAYQPGVAEPVVGRPTAEVGDASSPEGTWSRAEGETGPFVSLDLLAPAETPPVTVLLSCAGTVVGARAVDAPDVALHLEVLVRSDACAPDDLTLSYLDREGRRHDSGTSG